MKNLLESLLKYFKKDTLKPNELSQPASKMTTFEAREPITVNDFLRFSIEEVFINNPGFIPVKNYIDSLLDMTQPEDLLQKKIEHINSYFMPEYALNLTYDDLFILKLFFDNTVIIGVHETVTLKNNRSLLRDFIILYLIVNTEIINLDFVSYNGEIAYIDDVDHMLIISGRILDSEQLDKLTELFNKKEPIPYLDNKTLSDYIYEKRTKELQSELNIVYNMIADRLLMELKRNIVNYNKFRDSLKIFNNKDELQKLNSLLGLQYRNPLEYNFNNILLALQAKIILINDNLEYTNEEKHTAIIDLIKEFETNIVFIVTFKRDEDDSVVICVPMLIKTGDKYNIGIIIQPINKNTLLIVSV